jgi:hypothetical protein
MPRTRKRHLGPLAFASAALAACLLSFALAAARAAAQEPSAAGSNGPSRPTPTRPLPTPDQLEPGVNTTPPTTPPPAGASAGEADRSAGPAATSAKATTAAKGSTAPGATAAQPSTAAKAKGGKGPNRLELEATEITGNRELPKVLYIVPWKRSDLGELVGRPVNSLLDEVLAPLDRDVFQRENRYYNGLKGAAGAPQAGAAPAAETKP